MTSRICGSLVILAIIAGCGSSNQSIQAPPTHVLDALNQHCRDLYCPCPTWNNWWTGIVFHVVDADHSSVPFATGSAGAVCDGSHVYTPAGPISLGAYNDEGATTTSIPGNNNCAGCPQPKIPLNTQGVSGLYGQWDLDEDGVKTILTTSGNNPKTTLFVTGDSRCSGVASGNATVYKILTNNITYDYIGCSHSGNTTYPGTVVITLHAIAPKYGGNVACLTVNCN